MSFNHCYFHYPTLSTLFMSCSTFKVRACKKIVAEMLIKRQHDLYNELALRDAILFVHKDVRWEIFSLFLWHF